MEDRSSAFHICLGTTLLQVRAAPPKQGPQKAACMCSKDICLSATAVSSLAWAYEDGGQDGDLALVSREARL